MISLIGYLLYNFKVKKPTEERLNAKAKHFLVSVIIIFIVFSTCSAPFCIIGKKEYYNIGTFF